MSAAYRFRDAFREYTPRWLLDRTVDKLVNGYAFLWTLISGLDNLTDFAVQGIQAGYPGLATPTALAQIGRTRGIIRGQGESDDDYSARLLTWWERAQRLGSAEAIATDLHEFLSTHPVVRVVNRAGVWVSCASDGTLEKVGPHAVDPTISAWDWDSLSNPERNDPAAPYWSDLWVIVYSPPWTVDGTYADGDVFTEGGLGVGQDVSRNDYEQIKALIRTAKSAGSCVRAVIWSYDATKFDPHNGASTLPDGTWGRWGYGDPRTCTRDRSCRYWTLDDSEDGPS